MVALPFFRQVDFLRWRPAGFFEKGMEQNDFLVVHEKQGAGSPLAQAGADFAESFPKMPHQRHSEGPAKLHLFDIFADRLTVVLGKFSEPFPDGFVAAPGAKEDHTQGRIIARTMTYQ
jgi:hypothetical protein